MCMVNSKKVTLYRTGFRFRIYIVHVEKPASQTLYVIIWLVSIKRVSMNFKSNC